MSRKTKVLLAVLVSLAVVVAGALVLLPRIVRAKCVEAARAHGIDLTIGSVSLWFGSATFAEIDAKMIDPALPLTIHAREVKVTLDGLSPTEVDVLEATATLDGTLFDVSRAIDELRAKTEPQASERSHVSIRRVEMKGAHARWTRALGAGTALDASGVDVSMLLGANETLDALKILAPQVQIEGSAHGALGPLRAEATYGEKKVTVVISSPDPSKHATARYEIAQDRVLDVDIAKDKLSRYGFSALVPGKDPDVSVKLHAVNGRVTQGNFAYGPFKGTLGGTVVPEVPSAHLTYATDPISCAEIAHEMAVQLGGAIGGLAAQLGQQIKVPLAGQVHASGEIEWDARVTTPHLTFVTSQSCALMAPR
jgi:hypothetical protein